jgi:hypothetical protein
VRFVYHTLILSVNYVQVHDPKVRKCESAKVRKWVVYPFIVDAS